MCEKTRRKLAGIPTKKGDMTTGAQEGFAIMLEELEKNNSKMTLNNLKTLFKNIYVISHFYIYWDD